MRLEELDYDLPEDLIAQHPAPERHDARLLVADRAAKSIALDRFRNLPAYLRPGDCLVMNDTQVIRARLRGQKTTGGQAEIFLLRELSPGEWAALVRPSAKIKPGTAIRLKSGVEAIVEERLGERERRVRFPEPDVLALLEAAGEIPLPPYIKRDGEEAADLTRYQTVYADKPGAVAAPTAGLHYTDEVFDALREKGVRWTRLTLHVGYGTFLPITAENIADHSLEAEEFHIGADTARILNETREGGGRIVAVGTTSTRVLESQWNGRFSEGSGRTGHYIHPPYAFRAVDALQTNFHLPRTSLLALVYAFGGVDLVKKAYAAAIAERFRFYSYGDTMLIV